MLKGNEIRVRINGLRGKQKTSVAKTARTQYLDMTPQTTDNNLALDKLFFLQLELPQRKNKKKKNKIKDYYLS